MSLDFDLRRIPESVRLVTATADDPMHGIKAGDSIMNPLTNALIWGCMVVGIGEITEANYREWWGRYHLAERDGCFLYGPAPDHAARFVTLDEVRSHIGLRTNVFPKVSASAWLKRRIDQTVADVERKAARQNAA